MLDLNSEITHVCGEGYGLGWEEGGQRHCGRLSRYRYPQSEPFIISNVFCTLWQIAPRPVHGQTCI